MNSLSIVNEELIDQIVKRTSHRISKDDQNLILKGEPVEMTLPEKL